MAAHLRAWDRRRTAVTAAAVVAACVLFALTRARTILWDEAVYMGMAKYLASGGASGLWEMMRPPLLPLLAAPLWKSGLPIADAARLVAVLFAAGYLLVTYRLAREVAGVAAARVATGLCLVTPVFLKYAGRALADIPAMSLVLLALLLVLRGRPGWAGVATGAAFLAKFTHLLAAAPLLLLVAFGLFGLVMYARKVGPLAALTQPLTDAMRFQDNPYQNLPAATGGQRALNLLHYPIALVASPLGSVVFALALAAVALPAARRRALAPLLWLAAPLLAYFSAIPYKPERFLLFFVPLAAIAVAAAVVHALRRPRWRHTAALGALALAAGLTPALRHDWEWLRDPGRPTRAQQRALFGYFEHRAVAGPVVTASPLFCAFSDQRYLPAYDTRRAGHTFVNAWERDLGAAAAAYSDAGFACADRPCLERRERFFAALDSTLVIADVYRGFGERWFFFVGRRDGGR